MLYLCQGYLVFAEGTMENYNDEYNNDDMYGI